MPYAPLKIAPGNRGVTINSRLVYEANVRLTDSQRQTISSAVAAIFGDRAQLRLFGSRADDRLRGGDIDLHIQVAGLNPGERLDGELKLRAKLLRALGDRRIDVIVQDPSEPLRAIDHQALTTGVEL